MKIKLLIIILISFILLPVLTAGDSELDKLKAQNEAAIKKVIDTYENNLKIIDKAYLKKLQALMKFCMKKGDLDGAVAVREEINVFKEKLGVSDEKEDSNEDPSNEDSDNNTTENNTEDNPGNNSEKPNSENGDDKVFGEEDF